jgi:hypothetical protein
MNPQTFDKDVASIEPGGYLFYDCSRPIPASKFRQDITRHRRAADRDLQPGIYGFAPAPAVQEHHLRRRARSLARHGCEGDRAASQRAVRFQGKADRRQPQGAGHRPHLGEQQSALPDRPDGEARRWRRRPHLCRRQQRRRARRGLWRRHRLRLVSADAFDLAGRSLHVLLQEAAHRTADRPQALRHRSGRGRTRLDRHGRRRRRGTARAPSRRPPAPASR